MRSSPRETTPQPNTSASSAQDASDPTQPTSDLTAEPGASWTFRQTLIGAAVTLIPWLALSLALASAPQSASGQPTHRLAPAIDATSGVLIFIISAALEVIFTLAPLYCALRTRQPATGEAQADDADIAPSDWRSRWRLASERLGLIGWASSSGMPPGELAGSTASAGEARRRWRIFWLTLGLAAAALAASALYSYIITATHAPIATNSDALAQEAQTAPLTVLGSLLAAIFVAPLCEEVFFRAFLFRGLLRRIPLWPAILLASLLFAIAHTDLGSFIPLFIIGVALAFVRSQARSLWPSVAIHTLNNLIAALLLAPILVTALGK